METLAIVMEAPGQLSLRQLETAPVGDADVRVEIHWSGISTGSPAGRPPRRAAPPIRRWSEVQNPRRAGEAAPCLRPGRSGT